MENGTDYASLERALQLIEIMGEELYFAEYPNDDLELMIADIKRG